MSNTPPVENEHSSLASHKTKEATSSISPNRPIGIFDSIQSICCCVIWENSGVLTAAGVTQFTFISVVAGSLPSDLVRPMTPALEAEYAEAWGLPSLRGCGGRLSFRPQPLRCMNGTTARLQ